jgi:hypothetical protein
MLPIKFRATKFQEMAVLEFLSTTLLVNLAVTQLWGEGRLVTDDDNHCAAFVCGGDTTVG